MDILDNEQLEQFKRLTSILSNAGVKGLDFFTLKNFDGYGRGLSSILSRQPGEKLFKIPLDFIFTDYKIEEHPKLHVIFDKYPELLIADTNDQSSSVEKDKNAPPVFPFILLFYYELFHPSTEFNKIWFNLFSKDLTEHTIAWTDLELRLCGNLCPIRRDTIEIQVWIKKCYRTLKPIIDEFYETVFSPNINEIKAENIDNNVEFNESLVEYLCMLCRNRGCLLPLNENENEANDHQLYHCFVPIGDFGNHKIGAQSSIHYEHQKQRRHLNDENANSFVKYHQNLMSEKFFEYDSNEKCVIVRSQEVIIPGGQICYEYTAAPNWELLCNFGFAVRFNPYDRIIITVVFDNDDPRMKSELKMLEKCSMSSFLQKRNIRDENNNSESVRYILAVALRLGDACPNALMIANRIKILSDEQLECFAPEDIAFLDRRIRRMEKELLLAQGTKMAQLLSNINQLKSMEYIVLRNLKQGLNVLFDGYQSEDIPILTVDENVVRKEVHMVYKSIRSILQKSIMLLNNKIENLA